MIKPDFKKLATLVVSIGIVGWLILLIHGDTRGLRANEIVFSSSQNLSQPIKLVFISDIHLTDSASDFERLERIRSITQNFNPDLILFGGDFTGEHTQETQRLKDQILRALEPFTGIAPTYSVLGNHEWWTSPLWKAWLIDIGIDVIDGETRSIAIEEGSICLRGLGDAFTEHYIPVRFPLDCKGIRITLTHDPLAIELDAEPGLYLAGHTHCGQIKLPFIEPSWAPTAASAEYICGAGATKNKVWLTSSGVGTSVIPIRFGAPASIELITIL